MLSDEELSAYLDGDLSPDTHARVKRAIEEDDGLAERLEGMRALREQLVAGPLVGPARDLWPAVHEKLERPRWNGWGAWSIGGAGLAFAAAALLTVRLASPPTPGIKNVEDREAVAEAEDEIEAARAIYSNALAKLETRAKEYTQSLPEDDRMKLQTSLFEVEQAIARVESVIRGNPDDIQAHSTLVALYDQKLRVLKGTIEVAESILEPGGEF
ncbi:MAG: zf-HC2 domain-containing protein [Myxococcota bacterium]